MSNPLSVAALATFTLGPGQPTDNLTSLANGTARGLGSVGTALQQYYDDLVAPIQLKSGASGVSATGSVSFYIACSEDGSHWSGGINPQSTSDQSAFLTGTNLLVPLTPALSMTANATTYTFSEFSIYSVLGFMPSFWAVVVYNQSGAAFDATSANHIARHSLVSYV